MHVGVISDTHGLLRPEALTALDGSDLLLHAGDVGDPAILAALSEIAPLHAVRGNVDVGPWAQALPHTRSLDTGGVRLLLYHGHLEPPAGARAAAQVVVSGHSHRPGIAHDDDGRLLLNPGSAGPRRFRLPVTVARLRIENGRTTAELIDLL